MLKKQKLIKVIPLTIGSYLLVFFIMLLSLYVIPSSYDSYSEHIQVMNSITLSKNTTILNTSETSHMNDVRYLIYISFIIFLITIIIALKQKNITSLLKPLGITITSINTTIILILSVFGFNKFWNIFHKILFKGNFQFPVDSTIKTLYPDNYFLTFIIFFIMITTMLGISYLILSRYKTNSS